MAKDVKVQISPASQAVEFARQRARITSGAVCAIFASDMRSSVVAWQKVAASSTAISTAAAVADAVVAAPRAAAVVDRVRSRVRISFHLEHSGGRPAIVVQSRDEERADAGESGAAELQIELDHVGEKSVDGGGGDREVAACGRAACAAE